MQVIKYQEYHILFLGRARPPRVLHRIWKAQPNVLFAPDFRWLFAGPVHFIRHNGQVCPVQGEEHAGERAGAQPKIESTASGGGP